MHVHKSSTDCQFKAHHTISSCVHADQKALRGAQAQLAKERAAWAAERGQQEKFLQENDQEMIKAIDRAGAQRKAYEGKLAAMAEEKQQLSKGRPDPDTICRGMPKAVG